MVVTTAGAPIALLDPESGGIVRTVGQPLTWTGLDVAPWPPNGPGFRIIARSPRRVEAFDESGKLVLTYRIPSELGSGYSLAALSARLGQGSCLVTLLGTRSFWRRSILVVFDDTGRVVYQRIVRDTDGLAAFPPGAGRGRPAAPRRGRLRTRRRLRSKRLGRKRMSMWHSRCKGRARARRFGCSLYTQTYTARACPGGRGLAMASPGTASRGSCTRVA